MGHTGIVYCSSGLEQGSIHFQNCNFGKSSGSGFKHTSQSGAPRWDTKKSHIVRQCRGMGRYMSQIALWAKFRDQASDLRSKVLFLDGTPGNRISFVRVGAWVDTFPKLHLGQKFGVRPWTFKPKWCSLMGYPGIVYCPLRLEHGSIHCQNCILGKSSELGLGPASQSGAP